MEGNRLRRGIELRTERSRDLEFERVRNAALESFVALAQHMKNGYDMTADEVADALMEEVMDLAYQAHRAVDEPAMDAAVERFVTMWKSYRS